jgi:hypothetical protein
MLYYTCTCTKLNLSVMFEVLKVILMMAQVFWDMTPFGLVNFC